MVMVLWKKLLRTIKEKKAQYFSAWLLIVISSMLSFSFTTTGANMVDNLNSFYKTHHVEDAQFMLQAPLSQLDDIEKQYNVQIEKRVTADVSFNQNSVLRVLNATKNIDLYSVIDGEQLHSKTDILIDQGFAKAHHLSVDDKLKLNGQTFHVSGIMAVPDYIYPLKSVTGFLKNPQAFGIAIVEKDALNSWKQAQNYYIVQFHDQNKQEFIQFLNSNNHVLQWIDKKDNNRISFIKGDIAGIQKMGETLPIGILLITIVIILILLWRLMKKEYVQIGTLYAIGYKKKEIIEHYLTYSALLAISGSFVGTLLGWVLLCPLLSMFAAFYNLPVLAIKFHILYLFMSLFLPLIFFLPLTYFLIQRVLKIPPIILMKGGELKTKVNRIERLFKLKNFRFNTKFQIREILRNLPRVVFLIVGVLFATLLLLLGFVTKDSMDYLVKDNFKNVYHYKYDYIFNQLQTESPVSGQKGSSAPFTTKSQSLVITGLELNNTAIQLNDLKGKPLKFDSVIMNKSLADKLTVRPGDTLKVKNKLSNKTFRIKIDHIADSYLGDMIYMPLAKFNKLNGYPSGSYLELYSNKKLPIQSSKLVTVSKTSETIDGFNQIIQPLQYGIIAIALMAAIIAVIIIYVLISLIIEENSFKISLMKVLGYPKGIIQKLMIGYNVWFVILGFLLGIPVTIVSVSEFMNSITADMNINIPVKINWLHVLISFIILLLAYMVSILFSKKQLNRIQMSEAVKRSSE
jgi:putative ABC transport system permease protein